MAWVKPTEEITALHEELVRPFVCDKRKMFGFQVFFVNDNMFTGVFEDGIMIRMSPEDKKAAIGGREGVAPFTPMGREMKEYIFIPGKMLDEPAFLDEVRGWVAKSYEFVSAMPPKVKKAKKQAEK